MTKWIIMVSAMLFFLGMGVDIQANDENTSLTSEFFDEEQSDTDIWLIFGPEEENLIEGTLPEVQGEELSTDPNDSPDAVLGEPKTAEPEFVVKSEDMSQPQALETIISYGPAGYSSESEPVFSNVADVPEPSTFLLLGIGLLVIAGIVRRNIQGPKS